jgi:hypothetical protein
MDPTNDPVKSRGGTSSESSQPIRFAGSVLDAKRHVCAFFHSPDEEYRVLLPFIKEGFERGEKAFHIVDPKLRTEHAQRLASAGIDVEAAVSSSYATGLTPICAVVTSIRTGCSPSSRRSLTAASSKGSR